MGHHRWVLLLLAGVLAGCTTQRGGIPATSPVSRTATASASAAAPALPGTVVVTVHDLAGAAGGSLAGVLFSGPEAMYPDQRVVGGFGVAVDEEQFTTTQTIAEPGKEFEGAFPYVTQVPLQVPPGTYTLALWAAPDALGPYGRWVPSDTLGLRGCGLTFTVGAAASTQLDVYGIAPWRGTDQGCAADMSGATVAEFDTALGFMVPAGFEFAEATGVAKKEHAGLLAAAPKALDAQTTWRLRVGSISATVSRLTLSPDFTPAADTDSVDRLLQAVAATPHGSDSYTPWNSEGVRVGRAHRGWIDSYAWVDPRGGRCGCSLKASTSTRTNGQA